MIHYFLTYPMILGRRLLLIEPTVLGLICAILLAIFIGALLATFGVLQKMGWLLPLSILFVIALTELISVPILLIFGSVFFASWHRELSGGQQVD